MKKLYMKACLVFMGLLYCVSAMAVTKVCIGNLWYTLNGLEAIVTGYVGELGNLVIPETIEYNGQTYQVTKIGYSAFANCTTLTSLKSKSVVAVVQSIGDGRYGYPFQSCKKLQYIYFENIKLLEGDTFEDCPSLKYAVLGGNSIDCHKYAFKDCPQLQSVILLSDKADIELNNNLKIFHPSDFVTWKDSIFSYSGKSQSTTFTNNLPAGFVPLNSEITTFNNNAGTYLDSIPMTFSNSDVTFDVKIPYMYTIKKADLGVSVNNDSRFYGEENPQFTATYTGFVNGENESVLTSKGKFACSATPSSNVGDYPISINDVSAANYNVNYISKGILTIKKADLIVKADDVQRTYGAENPIFTISYLGLKNKEVSPDWTTKPTLVCSATKRSDIGNYDIIINGGEAKNYNITTSNGTLTISKADLKIKADNLNRQYYEQNPELTCSYEGFMNGEDASVLTTKPTLTTTATLESNADMYPINVSGAQAKNYSISFKPGTLEVKKRILNVSTDNYTRHYNEENPQFRINYKGFVNNENENVLIEKPTAATTAEKTTDVGTYPIEISGGLANNYDFIYGNGKLTIDKAYQNLTWEQDLSDIQLYSQVELKAKANSLLPITYTLSNDSVCELSYIGEKVFLDCFNCGTVTISAEQAGNKNYWPTTKIYKVLTVNSSTGIYGVKDDDKYVSISVIDRRIIIRGKKSNDMVRITSLSGALIYYGKDFEIQVPNGPCIIRVGNFTKKIVIK